MSEIKTLGPVGLNPLGDYNSETEYEKLDVVLYQGSSYVALQTVQGIIPTNTEYWQKLVSGGVGVDDIVDSLESNDSDKPLSANMGKELNDKILNTQSNIIIPEYVLTRYKKSTQDYLVKDNTLPYEIEGICYIETNKIIAFYSPVQNGITENSDCIVEEYDITNRTNPTLVRSQTISGLMHSNSCCYDKVNNKIYVALWGYYDNGTEVDVSKIAILDYSTLTVENIIEISNINNIGKIAFYNNNLYALDISNNIYLIDIENLDSTLLFQLNNVYGGGSQGFDIDNNIIYVNYSNPATIALFDFNSGEYIKTLSINEFDNVGHALGSYSSDISFVKSDLLLIACHKGLEKIGNTGSNTSFMANYLCKINLNGKGLANTPITSFFTNNEIYVNNSDIESTLYATGSSSKPLKLIDEYLNSYYKKLLDFKLNGSSLTYFGTLRLINDSLQLDTSLTAYGLYMKNAELDGQAITISSNPINIRGSRICSSNLTLSYSGDEKHSVSYSIINAPQISNSKNIINTSSIISGNNPTNIEFYNSVKQAILKATVSNSGNVTTADFSNYVNNTNFNPASYLLCVGLSTGENIVYPKTLGLGDARRFYDKDGNQYIVSSYAKSTKSLTITGTNASAVTVVTMVTI